MKRTAALLAAGMILQLLAGAPSYAGGLKSGVHFPPEQLHQMSFLPILPFDLTADAFTPPSPVIKAPDVSPIGGNQSNAPSWFVCTSKGIKLVRDGSIVKTHYCD
ncbi:hypothetical protein HBO12_00135 [Pseudomonas sp. WS 5059]|uniref:hypothetical protein n=1 Tax=unclassified Pseudomonas TaxID=196821 RepID=UPI001472C1C5|nr:MULTISPECIES: hypothetical protein [unclassified Pseudomonas]NMX60869.1 hypothetical protein [Pseudomonas sp. WS 5079]NMY01344.1 hypothetical protein [Pseudomonas sp. WS 5059]NMY29766.1 hypothetical protein [Pseudomonas sp. WS 5021]